MSVKDVWEKKRWKKKTYTDTGMDTDTHIHLLSRSFLSSGENTIRYTDKFLQSKEYYL